MKVTISDSLFIQFAKSAKNRNEVPTFFEWEESSPETARFVTDSQLKHARGTGQVAFLLETFFLHPEDYLTAMEKPFEYVLTHNSYLARHKGWLWYPHGGSFVDFKDWGIREKSRDVSVLLSHKKTLYGHKVFHEIAERYGDRVDVFGLDGYVEKVDAIGPYRFTIVVEAETTPSFFSEKMIDCFALGTVPIYMGCRNIGDFFDTLGMIVVDSVDEVGHILDVLNNPQWMYQARMGAIGNNFLRAMEYRIPEDWIYLHYPFLFTEAK